MAEENKPVEVPKEEAPATITDAVESTETPAQPEIKTEETAPAATEATTDTTDAPAAEATAEAAKEETKEETKKEVVPVENGQLEHKGSNFPKNFIYTKKFFWFGSEPVDVKKIPALLKDHHLAAWAAETGKGLLFVNEKGTDQTVPTSAIHLADAAEPTTDGPTKFVLTSKGHKHTFKAPTAADRDNWVSQLKLKISEAKELSKTVVESEKYKTTLASFTPVVAKKEEKAEEKKAEEAPKADEETPAAAATDAEAPAAATTEAPKEEAKEEAAKDVKADEGKRSASKKRASIFGALLGGNKEKKESEEKKIEETKAAEEVKPAEEAATETPAAATEVPAAESTTEAVKEPEAAATEPATESSETATTAKAADKPTPSKRASIFSGLSFGKKSKAEEAAPAPPAKDTEVSETAPVIPKPETTEPLSTDVSSPANVPVETTTTEAAPVVNGEKKPEIKSDKRKSSFPFAFGKKSEEVKEGEASTSPDAKEKANPFSKLRATIKGKGKAADKTEEKAEDKPAEGTDATKIEEEAATEEAKPTEDVKPAEENVPASTEEVGEPAKDTPVTSTPAVTASA